MYETYVGKAFIHGFIPNIHGFIPKMNNHITESRIGAATCKFRIHTSNYIKRNNRQLKEPIENVIT